MDSDGFFPDKGRSFERAEARRLAREAREQRDREANIRRIREQLEDGTAGVGGSKGVHCGICGSPWGRRGKPRNACVTCERERRRQKLAQTGREKETDSDRFEN